MKVRCFLWYDLSSTLKPAHIKEAGSKCSWWLCSNLQTRISLRPAPDPIEIPQISSLVWETSSDPLETLFWLSKRSDLYSNVWTELKRSNGDGAADWRIKCLCHWPLVVQFSPVSSSTEPVGHSVTSVRSRPPPRPERPRLPQAAAAPTEDRTLHLHRDNRCDFYRWVQGQTP